MLKRLFQFGIIAATVIGFQNCSGSFEVADAIKSAGHALVARGFSDGTHECTFHTRNLEVDVGAYGTQIDRYYPDNGDFAGCETFCVSKGASACYMRNNPFAGAAVCVALAPGPNNGPVSMPQPNSASTLCTGTAPPPQDPPPPEPQQPPPPEPQQPPRPEPQQPPRPEPQQPPRPEPQQPPPPPPPQQCAPFQGDELTSGLVFDPNYYSAIYVDLQAAFGGDIRQLTNHWLQYGSREGRRGSPNFDVTIYVNRYPDLQTAFGGDYQSAIRHFVDYGACEGRSGN